MSTLKLEKINKVFSNQVRAVYNFSLEVKENEFLVIVGPSGCGKSTLLRLIAGVEKIDSGNLYLDNRIINNVLPKYRNIAMVFQSYGLYPDMTVYENLSFGLNISNLTKEEINTKIVSISAMLGIENLLYRYPKELSGGQNQRVGLGRAILKNAEIYLMDEPLSNLDAIIRSQMRMEILNLHKMLNSTIIYVTHDQVEAMTMADRIVVMKDGEIQQIGTPYEVYNIPENKFVAGFMGSFMMNFLEIFDKELDVYKMFKIKFQKIIVGIRPEDVDLTQRSIDSLKFSMKIELVEFLGNEYILTGKIKERSFRINIKNDLKKYVVGDKVTFFIDKSKLHIFDYITEKRINLN